MLHDHRGLAVSTDSSAALEHFETALAQFHAYRGDAIATLDQALATDESFVLAHLAKVFMLATAGEGRYVPLARLAVTRAEELSGQANAREHALLAAARQLVDGEWHDALAASTPSCVSGHEMHWRSRPHT